MYVIVELENMGVGWWSLRRSMTLYSRYQVLLDFFQYVTIRLHHCELYNTIQYVNGTIDNDVR